MQKKMLIPILFVSSFALTGLGYAHLSDEISLEDNDCLEKETDDLFSEAVDLIEYRRDYKSMLKAKEYLRLLDRRGHKESSQLLDTLMSVWHKVEARREQGANVQHFLNHLRSLHSAMPKEEVRSIADRLSGSYQTALSDEYRKALEISANLNNPDAMVALGDYLMSSDRPSIQSIEGALNYFERAAEQGNLAAHFRLGEIYEYGLRGCAIDISRAEQNYFHAARLGSIAARFALLRLPEKKRARGARI